MNEHKKIIIFPGATGAQLHLLESQIKSLAPGGTLIMSKFPTIIDIEDVRTLSKEDVSNWCQAHNLKLHE